MTKDDLFKITLDAFLTEKYYSSIKSAMKTNQINTPQRQAHFLSQICHESNSFRTVSENLNYSAPALRRVFSKYFIYDTIAKEYARQPEKIANRVYANRMGNGDEASGDGWRFKGRGLIQLTGKENYINFAKYEKLPPFTAPSEISDNPELACKTAGWFWSMRNLNSLADIDQAKEITRQINGGYHGLGARTERLAEIKNILGIRKL